MRGTMFVEASWNIYLSCLLGCGIRCQGGVVCLRFDSGSDSLVAACVCICMCIYVGEYDSGSDFFVFLANSLVAACCLVTPSLKHGFGPVKSQTPHYSQIFFIYVAARNFSFGHFCWAILEKQLFLCFTMHFNGLIFTQPCIFRRFLADISETVPLR